MKKLQVLLLLYHALCPVLVCGVLFTTSELRNRSQKISEEFQHVLKRALKLADCDGPIPAYLKFFDELSEKERLAARHLGWSAKMWDEDHSPSRYSQMKWDYLPDIDPAAQNNFLMLGVDSLIFEGFYSDFFWGELDPQLQAAAAGLGFTKPTWNTCYKEMCIPIQEAAWADLTGAERAFAKDLGYSCHSWEFYLGPDNVDNDECVPPFYNRNWRGLPVDPKKAAKRLGYNQTSWNKDLDIDFPDTWDDLTEEERTLFGELGYNEGSYNDQFRDFEWADLPASIQSAATLLHLNQDSWDNCSGFSFSRCNDLSWNQLSLGQKEAADEIGYTCWDYGD